VRKVFQNKHTVHTQGGHSEGHGRPACPTPPVRHARRAARDPISRYVTVRSRWLSGGRDKLDRSIPPVPAVAHKRSPIQIVWAHTICMGDIGWNRGLGHTVNSPGHDGGAKPRQEFAGSAAQDGTRGAMASGAPVWARRQDDTVITHQYDRPMSQRRFTS